VDAIGKAEKNKTSTYGRKKLDMLVIRISAAGKLVNSRPCGLCSHLLREFGIHRLYFSDDSGLIRCIKPKNLGIEYATFGVKKFIDRHPHTPLKKIFLP
jgi:hypothetical protein